MTVVQVPPPSSDDQTYVPDPEEAEQISLMTDVRPASVDGVRIGYASDAFRRGRGTVSGSLLTRLRGMVA